MDFHPIANIFPMLSPQELEDLAADIKANGLNHKITTYQNKILDGRNRFVACELAFVKPQFVEYTGNSPVQFVISENLKRRHLDTSQRAMVADRIAQLPRGGQTGNDNATKNECKIFDIRFDGMSQGDAADILNVSRPMVVDARKIREEGIPELTQLIDAGQATVTVSKRVVEELPEPELQLEFVDRVKHGEKPTEALKSMAHVGYNSGNNEWYTPKDYANAARSVMGIIDLDPASTELANSVIGADEYYTKEVDGLSQDWSGRVWMNPPYSSDSIGKFILKLADNVRSKNVPEAVVLVNNATETAWFNELISVASAVCFPIGRVKFWSPDNSKTAAPLQGQAIVYVGDNSDKFRETFKMFGWTATL